MTENFPVQIFFHLYLKQSVISDNGYDLVYCNNIKILFSKNLI